MAGNDCDAEKPPGQKPCSKCGRLARLVARGLCRLCYDRARREAESRSRLPTTSSSRSRNGPWFEQRSPTAESTGTTPAFSIWYTDCDQWRPPLWPGQHSEQSVAARLPSVSVRSYRNLRKCLPVVRKPTIGIIQKSGRNEQVLFSIHAVFVCVFQRLRV